MTTRFPSALFRARAAVFAATLLCALAAQAAETPRTTTGSRIPARPITDLDDVHVIGAVEDPADAAHAEDTSLPALPVVSTPRGR